MQDIKILVVDDEEKMGIVIEEFLKDEFSNISRVTSAREAIKTIRSDTVHIVISDIKMPEIDGIELLRIIKKDQPGIEVILMTAYARVETAVEALRLGAYDYLIKPVNMKELSIKLKRLVEKKLLLNENIELKNKIGKHYRFKNIIAESKQMRDVLDKVTRVAPTPTTVLVTGESGTGKEVIANCIHYQSNRAKNRFVKINCAAIPVTLLEAELFGHEKGAFTGAYKKRIGKFEYANNGTVFLDEISEIPGDVQVKLLRVLQENEFERVGGNETIKTDIRLITATNRNLKKLVSEGIFREDLFYRLNVFPIDIPPLRERPSDIPLLLQYFLKKNCNVLDIPQKNIDDETITILSEYSWRGNVRELENAIEHSVVMGRMKTTLSIDDFPENIKNNEGVYRPDSGEDDPSRRKTLQEIEKEMLIKALGDAGGNQTRAAKSLGITRRTLGYRMQKYNIKV